MERGDSCDDRTSRPFLEDAGRFSEWIARYLAGELDHLPVLSRAEPGEIAAALPGQAPSQDRPMTALLDEFMRVMVPGLTHWNHPGFMAYFPSTGSASGVLAEFLIAALNQQAMLWRTSPTATEVENVTLKWLQSMLGLPPEFTGVTFDGGSMSNMHAILAARHSAHGCMSMPPGPEPPRYCPSVRPASGAWIRPTRWWSTRTSGCSRHST
jgi:glutamate/tyrosine decarboxylase-like PLP-dependent enzyme